MQTTAAPNNLAHRLQLYLLGTPRVIRDAEPVTAFRTSKSQGLLYYLAVTGSVQQRSTLFALLWPEYHDKRAGASLRTTLSNLRKLIGDHLVTTRQTVHLHREGLWLDAAHFDALLRRTGDRVADVVQMQAAVSLYTGDFLEGFHVPDAPQFEQWITTERERLRQAMLNALLALADWHADLGDHATSLDHLTRLLAIEPSSEAGHREKMTVLARMGQRSAALQQFEACRRILAEEMDVEPSSDTMAVYELILTGTLGNGPLRAGAVSAMLQPAPFAPDPQPSRPAQESPQWEWGDMPLRTAFYGRQDDVALMKRWLTGEGVCLAAISGLGGVGKTTLAGELVGRLGHGPFDAIAWRSLVNAPLLSSVLDDWLQALGGHADRLPDSPDEKLALLFAELQNRRCLLVLDNLESIMDAGVRAGHFRPGYEDYGQLIDRLARSRHGSCLLLTTRELPRGLHRLEEDYPRVRLMALAGLSPASGMELLRARGLTGLDSSLESLVTRYSGNPLALKLVADTVRDLFGGDVKAFLGGETPVFDDIRQVLDGQFARLSDLEKEIIVWLAVEREPVPAQVLWDDLARPPKRWEFVEVMRSLQRGSLVEGMSGDDSGETPRLSLQNVVMEYVTERLVDTLCHELETGEAAWLHRHALVKAHSQQYVQESQRRVILQPVARWLLDRWGRAGAIRRLQELLGRLRQEAVRAPSYAGANILHLLVYLQADLHGYDFSHLAVWQADLRQASLVDVDLRGADLTGSAFANDFGAILSMAVSPDGRLIAAGGTDGVVYVWSSADYQPTYLLRGHGNFITAVAFSDDSRYLATGGFDTEIHLWDMKTGTQARSLRRHGEPLQTWCISMEGDLLAVAGMDKTIHLWNWRRGESLSNLTVTGLVDVVAIQPGGRLLAGVGQGGELVVWDIGMGEVVQQRHAGTGRNLTLAFSPDGEILAIAGENNYIQLWRTADMSLHGIMAGHDGWILSLAFSPDGRHLAGGGTDRTVRIWDVDSGEPLQVLAGHDGWVRAVGYVPGDQILVTGGDDQTLRLWDIHSGELRHYLQGYMRSIDLTAFSPDGRLLVSSSLGGFVHLWDVESGRLLRQLLGRQATTRALTFSHDSAILACGSDDHLVRLWHAGTGTTVRVLHGHHGPVRDIAFSPDDRYLVTGSYDGEMRIWDTATGYLRQVLQNASTQIQFATAFDPGGEFLAFGTLDHTVKLLHVQSGEIVGAIPMADKVPNVVAFGPRGDLLACGARDGTVWTWDVALSGTNRIDVGAPRHRWHLDREPVWRLLFSPDGQLLVYNSEAPDTPVLDIASGELRYAVPTHYGAYSLAFSRDGQLLITMGPDNTILLRDAATGEVRQSLHGHTSGLTSLSYSLDDRLIASSSGDGSVRLWDGRSGDCLHVLEPERPYARMNIAGVTGITPAQRDSLLALGAVET